MKAIQFLNKSYPMLPAEGKNYPPKPRDAKTVRQLLDMERKPLSEDNIEYFEMPYHRHGVKYAYAYVRMENTEPFSVKDRIEIEDFRRSVRLASQIKREERAAEREQNKIKEREERKNAMFRQLAAFHDKNIIVFDVETTGFSPYYDELLQISMVSALTAWPILDTYIRPINRRTWPQAEEVNHISPEMVQSAPTADMIADKVVRIFQDADVIAGHNVAFDARFIKQSFDYKIPEDKLLDTMKIYRSDAENRESYSLESAVEYYCPEYFQAYKNGAHSSLIDTVATARVLSAQIEKAQSAIREDFKQENPDQESGPQAPQLQHNGYGDAEDIIMSSLMDRARVQSVEEDEYEEHDLY